MRRISTMAVGLVAVGIALGAPLTARGAAPTPKVALPKLKALPHAVGVEVLSFDTAKVLHDVGEPVTFRATVRFSHAPHIRKDQRTQPPFVVEVWDEHDLGAPKKVAEKGLTPAAPHKPCTVELTWNPGQAEYGHQAHLHVLDRHGRRLATADTVYEVCHDWTTVLRLAATIGYTIAGEQVTEDEMRRQIAYLRRGHYNAVELFGWMPECYDLTPDTPTWKCVYYKQPGRPVMSEHKLKLLAKLLHENGMKLVAYNESSAIDPKLMLKGEDPAAYHVYYRHGGKLHLAALYLRERGNFMPNALKITDLFARELAESVKRFDWDGLLMDSTTQAFFQTAGGFDAQGNRLTDLTPGQVGKRYVDAARRAVAKVKPNFRLVCQNVVASALTRHYHWRQPNDQLEAVIGAYMRKHYGDLFGAIDMWSGEMDTHYENQAAYPQTYDKYALLLNIARAVSGKPVLLWSQISPPYVEEYTPAFAVPLLSVLAAGRVSWHDHFINYGGLWGPWQQAPINRAHHQVQRFVARFGRYLRAPDLRWVRQPERSIRVHARRELFWKRTVYERTAPDGTRELTVNLVNLDTPFIRPSNVGRPAHVVPPIAFPVSVRLTLPKGTTADALQGFALDATDAALRALPLQAQREGDAAVFAVPPVRSWMVLVLRCPAE